MSAPVHPEVHKFLSVIGKKGGSSKSPYKVKASIDNGKLGGRPKKEVSNGTKKPIK
jgi:hypothetical protein